MTGMPRWQPAYVGIGSNLEEPRAQVMRAWERLQRLPETRAARLSPLYGSRAFGPVAQPDFVNGVAGLLTGLDVRTLFESLKAIERASGRTSGGPRWGPRIIDLDLLVYGGARLAEPDLVVPHPGIVERNFVLYPLADIAPDLDVPGLGGLGALKAGLAPDGLWRLEATAPG